jgi:hypothetical protein
VDRIVAALADTPVAIGARGLRAAPGSGDASARQLAVQTGAMRVLLGLPFHDTQCGCKAPQQYGR